MTSHWASHCGRRDWHSAPGNPDAIGEEVARAVVETDSGLGRPGQARRPVTATLRIRFVAEFVTNPLRADARAPSTQEVVGLDSGVRSAHPRPAAPPEQEVVSSNLAGPVRKPLPHSHLLTRGAVLFPALSSVPLLMSPVCRERAPQSDRWTLRETAHRLATGDAL